MTLLLLRHVHAGDRDTYAGPDRDRPISARGERQAQALVATLAQHDVVAVVSSPYVRCLGSVAPVARARQLEVESVDELAEGSPPDVVARFLRTQARRAGDGAVLVCSHGDVIGDVVTALARAGAVDGDDLRWPKASCHVFDGDLERPRVGYLPPPA